MRRMSDVFMNILVLQQDKYSANGISNHSTFWCLFYKRYFLSTRSRHERETARVLGRLEIVG